MNVVRYCLGLLLWLAAVCQAQSVLIVATSPVPQGKLTLLREIGQQQGLQRAVVGQPQRAPAAAARVGIAQHRALVQPQGLLDGRAHRIGHRHGGGGEQPQVKAAILFQKPVFIALQRRHAHGLQPQIQIPEQGVVAPRHHAGGGAAFDAMADAQQLAGIRGAGLGDMGVAPCPA